MKPKARLMWIAGTVTAITAIWGAWVQMGGAIPATQSHVLKKLQPIKKIQKLLTEDSAHVGAEVYRQKVRGLLIIPPPENPEQREIWKDIIKGARRDQKYYEQKEIDLRK